MTDTADLLSGDRQIGLFVNKNPRQAKAMREAKLIPWFRMKKPDGSYSRTPYARKSAILAALKKQEDGE